jgi:hypothetical protein
MSTCDMNDVSLYLCRHSSGGGLQSMLLVTVFCPVMTPISAVVAHGAVVQQFFTRRVVLLLHRLLNF